MRTLKNLLTLTLMASVSTAAALLVAQRVYHEREAMRADLMLAQDRTLELVDELTEVRHTNQLQHQALTQPTSSEGGVWLFKNGWHAPRGPFERPEEARAEAEVAATHNPGDIIHVLTSTSTVATARPEPEWEHPRSSRW